ncbi:MAG: ATP-binding protein [Candidatus Micrarchaeota archaeon]
MFSLELLQKMVAEEAQANAKSAPGILREKLAKLPADPVGQIAVVVGPRRCGKSTLLLQFITTRLKGKGYAYFNFDDERLAGFTSMDFDILLSALYAHYGDAPYLFFDEIHNITGWELFANRMQRQGRKVYITGSNSKLMSQELGTRLTGRHLDFELLPFSFPEFLAARQTTSAPAPLTTMAESALSAHFNAFLALGGFPQAVLSNDRTLLGGIYSDIINKDILQRHALRKPAEFRQIAQFVLSNASKPLTHRSTARAFGLKSPLTASKYVALMEQAYLIFRVPFYSPSLKVQSKNPFKCYCIDTGLAAQNSVRFSEDTGRMLENSVAVELKRRGFTVYYLKDSKGREVDFVLQKSDSVAGLVQACAHPDDPMVRSREEEPLVAALGHFKLKEGVIVTLDYSQDKTIGGKKISYVPAYKWFCREHK